MNTLQAQFTVKVGGKNVKCHLSMNAFRILTQKFGVKLAEIDSFVNADPLTALPALAWCGAVNHYSRKGEEFNMGFEQFAALMLDSEESISKVTEALASAFGAEEAEGNK